jgi:O-antigen/teichoic acid export membrane protein
MGGNALVAWLYGDVYTVAPALFWLLAAGAGIRLIRAVPGTALMALERTHHLLFSNLPRLITVALAFWAAAHGSGLTAIVAIAVCGEGFSLLIALAAIGASGGEETSRTGSRAAAGI